MTSNAARLATEMWSIAKTEEQCAQVVPDDALADEVRALVRRLASNDGIRVRTARMNDALVIVRYDAKVWTQGASTMRRKLAPVPEQTTV